LPAPRTADHWAGPLARADCTPLGPARRSLERRLTEVQEPELARQDAGPSRELTPGTFSEEDELPCAAIRPLQNAGGEMHVTFAQRRGKRDPAVKDSVPLAPSGKARESRTARIGGFPLCWRRKSGIGADATRGKIQAACLGIARAPLRMLQVGQPQTNLRGTHKRSFLGGGCDPADVLAEGMSCAILGRLLRACMRRAETTGQGGAARNREGPG